MIGNEEKQAIIDLFPFLGERPVVFDIGSNKGGFAEIILDEFKDNVTMHLFEPNKMLLDFTRIKFEYKTNIIYNESCVSNKSGNETFYYFENYNNEMSSRYHGNGEWEGLPVKQKKVPVITLDEYCKENNIQSIDYLKIDCEGADVEVLEGVIGMIKLGGVRIIQIEYSPHYKRAGKTFQQAIDIAKSNDYKIYKYIDNNFWEVKHFDEDYQFDNFFITKEEIHNYSTGGWNGSFILNTIELPKFDLMLEIGAMEGMTTKYMCQNMLNEGGRVIVVDPLYNFYVEDDPRYHPEFRGQYQRFLRNTRGLPVELKRGKSEDELPKLNALRHDFIYVDGNHYAPWPYHDGCWAFAICKVGGYVLFDDYNLWAQDTKDSIDKFLNEYAGFYEIVQNNYQILIKKTANRYNEITQSYYL